MGEVDRSCPSGKVRYPTLPAARRWAQKFMRASKHRKPQPYHCPGCNGWHLTSHGSDHQRAQKNNRRLKQQRASRRWDAA